MRIPLPQRISALVLSILLVLLLALAGVLWWRVSAASPALEAQTRAAEELLGVRAAVADGVVEDPDGVLERRIDEQLAVLAPAAREKAGEPAAPEPGESPARIFDDSAQRLYELSGSQDLEPRQAALLGSIAVSHWLTARGLEGTLQEVPSLEGRTADSLDALLGASPADAALSAGLCPDGAADDARSRAVGEALSELYATTWSDDVLVARTEADAREPVTEQSIRDVARVHAGQLGELRRSVPPGCQGIPQPAAAYAMPDADPAQLRAQQSTALSERTFAILAAEGGRSSAETWRSWSLRWLAVNTALGSSPASVPALPGTPAGAGTD
ncbi:hypothetical protein NBM05_03230 [Rothia sp. AR01]|uniref:Uncharacterized protein n=1 Tax=Rothia santali TaxID=2949643 RepID=A0A9X2KKH6_9MICC|nr:hypothetical protein [Rothia santali]MCP3425066.1 hypothetical protein [Rothia santali]